jgi:iron complex outermembrane receptor protein
MISPVNWEASRRPRLSVDAVCPRHRTATLAIALTGALGTGSVCGAAFAADDTLDEVVVTAQKREQRAQDVGITLRAFSADTLREFTAFSAPDIARLTPGVGISGSFAGQNAMFSVRGITQQDFQAHAESPVAVYIDEGYLAANNISGIGLLDVEQVEVLKGPQGTLFGRNATGGLVSITTRKPTKEFEAQGGLTLGAYSDRRAEVAVGGPLTERVQGRVALLYQENDGWVRNLNPNGGDLGGKQTSSGRVHIAAQPSDAMNFLFTGYYSDTDQSWGPYFVLSTRSTVSNGIPNAVIVNQPTAFFGNDPFTGLPYVAQPPSDAENRKVDADSAQDDGAFNEIGGGTFRLNYRFGDGLDLTAITDYKKLEYLLLLDDDATSQTFFDTITSAEIENYSQELRVFKDWGKTQLTTGAYYLHIDSSTVDLQRPFFFGVQVSSPFRLKTDSTSAFVQAEHDFSERWTLIGGFRLTREEKDFQYDSFAQDFDGNQLAVARQYRGSLSDWLYSGKLQVEYHPSDDLLVFAGFSRGTKAGSFNAPFAGSATPADPEIPYDAEELNAFEIGAKATLFGGLATLNGAIFYYDYDDYQAFKFENFAAVVTNNPAEITGAEFDFTIRPMTGLEFLIGASYIDATVEDVFVSNSLGSATLERRPPYSSEFQGTVSARYEFPVATGNVIVQANAQHSSDSFISVTNFDATRIDSYTLVGARVAWESADRRWELAAFGRNLTDERYKQVGFEASDFGGWTQISYGEPRWWGVSFTLRR